MLKRKLGIGLLACVLAALPIYASYSFASSADELRSKLTEIEQQKRVFYMQHPDFKVGSEESN